MREHCVPLCWAGTISGASEGKPIVPDSGAARRAHALAFAYKALRASERFARRLNEPQVAEPIKLNRLLGAPGGRLRSMHLTITSGIFHASAQNQFNGWADSTWRPCNIRSTAAACTSAQQWMLNATYDALAGSVAKMLPLNLRQPPSFGSSHR